MRSDNAQSRAGHLPSKGRGKSRKNGEETRERILLAAQQLFAQQGVRATSLRAIARAAEIHQPSLHYHFKNKADLFRAVLDLRIVPLYQARLAALDELERDGRGDDLGAILAAAQRPIIQAWADPIAPGVSIVHLIYRGVLDDDPEWQAFEEELTGPSRERFIDAFARCLPHLDHLELLQRLSFLEGALAGLYLDRTKDEMTRAWGDLHSDLDAFEARMIGMCTTVLRAPSTC